MTGQLERSQRLELTGRRIVAGTWGCAGITMAASAANAALTYGALGDNRALGLATGVAVDIGLCVALIGDRQLYAHGLSSNWGRALRITTAVMSLILNVGISLRDGHYFAALLHSFLPVLLIVLCEYGQDVLLQLTALRRKQDAEQPTSPPAPVVEPLPQLHRPLAPPVTAGRVGEAAATTPQPRIAPPLSQPTAPPRVAPAPQPATVRTSPQFTTGDTAGPSAGSGIPDTAATGDDLVARVRRLLAEAGGRAPGRRAVAKQLGVTEHQARGALDLVAATTGPALNGAGGKSKPATSGRGAQ